MMPDAGYGRTAGEWLLINKALSPVSFPALLGLANRTRVWATRGGSGLGNSLLGFGQARHPRVRVSPGRAAGASLGPRVTALGLNAGPATATLSITSRYPNKKR